MARAGSPGGSGNSQAHQSMRINLASVIFPFTKDLWGRSIIVPQFDENYQKQLVASADAGKDKGVPMACYIHNCMPTTEGYQSISFDSQIVGNGVPGDFDRVFSLLETTPADARFLFSPANGKNYIFDATAGATWKSISPLPSGSITDNTLISTSYIQGQTYIYFGGINCYTYDQVNKVLVLVTLAGLTPSAVLGLTTSFGYMIAWSVSAIAWSNVTNPIDFVPSLITGAGGGQVNDVKGNMVYCVPVGGGFLIFCEKNVVGAKYTGNIRFPFIFKEISGSGGIVSQDQIAIGSNVGEVYAWTSVGLQVFTVSTCENVFPDVSDFLSKLIYEDFDESTITWTETNLSNALSVKLAIVANRFLIVSYGVSYPNYTYAVIYDSTLKRWGKVKVTHRCCFQWNSPNLFGAITYGQLGTLGLTYGGLTGITYGQLGTSINTPELPLKTIAFLQADGGVKIVNFNLSESAADGVLMIGKFQFERNKFIVHQYHDVENIVSGAPFASYIIPTIDGKTQLTPVPAVQIRNGALTQRWAKRVAGQNVSILWTGAFNLTSVILDFTLGGDR